MNMILLQAEGAAQQGSHWSFWVMLIIIFVVCYFFMIRPVTRDKTKREKTSGQQPLHENTCPICENSYDTNYEFCPHCGSRQVKECPKCGLKNLPKEALFCPECGTKI